jgi:hypothetical protein
MSARLQAALWIVAVVVTPLGVATANAQPPVLPDPASRSGELLPEERPTDFRPLLHNLLIGLHPAAGLVDVNCLVDVDDEPAAPALSLREIPEYVLQFMRSVGEPTGQALPIESSTICPYLKRQKECEQSHSDTKSPRLCDFAENLKKLSVASQLYDRGVAHLQEGDRDGAMYLFAQVREMVPGSRFDSGAKEQIARMDEIKGLLDALMSVDFRDKPFKHVLRELGSKAKLDIRLDEERLAEEQVDLGKPVSMQIDQMKFKSILNLLLRGFDLRYVIEGDVVKITTADHANSLPKTKFFPVEDLLNWKSIDLLIDGSGDGPISYPETVDAKQIEQLATVLRQRFLQIEPKSWACDGGLGTIEFDSSSKRLVVYQGPNVLVEIEKWLDELRRRSSIDNERKEDHSRKSPSGSNETGLQDLKVSLPAIDPKIVDALQKVLNESANPTVPRLIIHVEDQPAAEEQEPAVPSEWSIEPREEEIPRLLIDPVEDQMTITSEEESDEPKDLSPEEWNALLREVIDAIRGGLSEEVEINAVLTGVPHREQFGDIGVEVTIGSGGEQYVRVSLSPEASGDLRAAQRAHNERILRWIESLNEPCAEGEDDAAEEEDAAYGDEPRNEAIP